MGNKIEEALLWNGFDLNKYEEQVLNHGLDRVWDFLIHFLKDNGVDVFSKTVVDFYDIGRLYEIGLAVENKYSKNAILDGGIHHLVYYGQTMAMKVPYYEIYPKRNEEGKLRIPAKLAISYSTQIAICLRNTVLKG